MNIDIATLFPEMLENYLSESVVGRARAKNIFTVTCHNIRDYTQDKHRRVDDTPYSERQGYAHAVRAYLQLLQVGDSWKGKASRYLYVPTGKNADPEACKGTFSA